MNRMTAKQWLEMPVNFGGELTTRGGVYRWFDEQGYTRRNADYWLMGYIGSQADLDLQAALAESA